MLLITCREYAGKKKSYPIINQLNSFLESAHDWIRTSTPLKAPAPQAGMSTDFTTWARLCKDRDMLS